MTLRPALLGMALLAGVLAPTMLYPVLLMKVLCFAIFASAFNLLLGYVGLLSFGHAAFFGGAAYVTGYLMRDAGWGPLSGVLAGTLSATVLGWCVGKLAIRRQGIYFAMITLALAQMLYFICLELPQTGGEDGLQGIPRGTLAGLDLSNDLTLYYVILGASVLVFALLHRTIHSPFGRVLTDIRENEPRAISLGYDVARYKLLAFVLSATLSGLAGALKVLVFKFATLTDAHWHMSGDVVLMTILGGMGTVPGPMVGAALIVSLEDQLADKVGSLVTVILGGVFVLCVLLFRRGIVGEMTGFWQRLLGQRNSSRI